MNDDEIKKLQHKLEEWGEVRVREMLASGKFVEKKRKYVESWLEQKDREQSNLNEQMNREFAENSNRLASEANKISKKHLYVSWIAIVISIIALIVSIFY